jgi:prevent-host-death family protein
MKQVAAAKFKATCLRLMEQVAETGEPIQVTKRGKPLVVITPPRPAKRPASIFGSCRHLINYLAPDEELFSTGAVWEAVEGAKKR